MIRYLLALGIVVLLASCSVGFKDKDGKQYVVGIGYVTVDNQQITGCPK